MNKIIILYSLIDDYIIDFSSELNINDYDIYAFEDINDDYSDKKIDIKIIDEDIYKNPIEELVVLKIYNNSDSLINKTKDLISFFLKSGSIIYDCNGLFNKITKNNYFNLIMNYSDKKFLIERISLLNSVMIANIESQFCQEHLEKIVFSYLNDKKYAFIPTKTIFSKNKKVYNFDWEQYNYVSFNAFTRRFYNLTMNIKEENILSLIVSVPSNFLPFSHTELYNGLHSMVSALVEPKILILCLPLFKLKKDFYNEMKNEIKKIHEFMHIIFVNSNTTHDKYWIDGEIPITYSNDEIKENHLENYYNDVDIFNFNDIVENNKFKNLLLEVLSEKNF